MGRAKVRSGDSKSTVLLSAAFFGVGGNDCRHHFFLNELYLRFGTFIFAGLRRSIVSVVASNLVVGGDDDSLIAYDCDRLNLVVFFI